MVNQLRVGIVGAGLMGHWHARYAQRCGAKIVAVTDPAQINLKGFLDRFPSATAFSTFEQSLSESILDVVHVCSPVGTHFDITLGALNSKLAVLCEKPFCPNENEAKKLLEIAKTASVTLAPVHQLANQSGFNTLLNRMERIGELVMVSHLICSHGAEGKTTAERKKILLEILPHSAYLLFRFLGSAEPIDALQVVRFTDDALTLNCHFNGTLVNVEISLKGRPARNEFVVIGSKGSATVDLFHGFLRFENQEDGKAGKLLRPFVNSSSTFVNAFANLAVRAARIEPAFPGLLNTIDQFYNAVQLQTSTVEDEEILCTSRLYERISECSQHFN